MAARTAVALILLLPSPAQAALIRLSVSDAVGDHAEDGSAIDLVGLSLTIDNATGEFWIDFSASSTAPFTGLFVVAGNFTNLTRGGFWIFDNAAVFDLGTDTTESLSLGGVDRPLTSWSPGDEVAYFVHGRFSSKVTARFPSSGRDFVGPVGISFPVPVLSATLTEPAVSEPPAGALWLLGLAGLAAWRLRSAPRALVSAPGIEPGTGGFRA